MKILLTGSNGFTGRHFKEAAANCQHEVVDLKADLTDLISLRSELEGKQFDAVVHLAAISFVGHKNKNDFYTVNVVGTTNLLDVLVQLNRSLNSVLIASSANIYGNCETSPIAESQLPAPVNHYSVSKVAMELMARNYVDKLPLFFVRPFNYTGVGQDLSFIIPKLVDHFKRKANVVELGNIHVEREFNDVRFVCEAYLKLLEKFKVGETYNICTNNPMSLSSVITDLTNITGHHIQLEVNPAFVRANEIHSLCGDNSMLTNTLGTIKTYTIQETLSWMLDI